MLNSCLIHLLLICNLEVEVFTIRSINSPVSITHIEQWYYYNPWWVFDEQKECTIAGSKIIKTSSYKEAISDFSEFTNIDPGELLWGNFNKQEREHADNE